MGDKSTRVGTSEVKQKACVITLVAVDPLQKVNFWGFSGKPLDFSKSESLKIQPSSSQVKSERICSPKQEPRDMAHQSSQDCQIRGSGSLFLLTNEKSVLQKIGYPPKNDTHTHTHTHARRHTHTHREPLHVTSHRWEGAAAVRRHVGTFWDVLTADTPGSANSAA